MRFIIGSNSPSVVQTATAGMIRAGCYEGPIAAAGRMPGNVVRRRLLVELLQPVGRSRRTLRERVRVLRDVAAEVDEEARTGRQAKLLPRRLERLGLPGRRLRRLDQHEVPV